MSHNMNNLLLKMRMINWRSRRREKSEIEALKASASYSENGERTKRTPLPDPLPFGREEGEGGKGRSSSSLGNRVHGESRQRLRFLNRLLPAVFALVGAMLLALGTVSCKKQAATKPPDVDYYTCTMHPSVKSQDPNGKCPICSMDLVPVKKKAAGAEKTSSQVKPQEQQHAKMTGGKGEQDMHGMEGMPGMPATGRQVTRGADLVRRKVEQKFS